MKPYSPGVLLKQRAPSLQVTFRMLRPILPFFRKFQDRLAKQIPVHPDIFVNSALSAKSKPSRASGIRVTIVSCHDLVMAQGTKSQSNVSYQFPGYPHPVDSPFCAGISPVVNDSHVFEFGDSPQSSPMFAKALREFVLLLVCVTQSLPI